MLQEKKESKEKNKQNYEESRIIDESLMMYLGERKGENENSGKFGISEKQDSSQGLILLKENYRVIRQQTNRGTRETG